MEEEECLQAVVIEREGKFELLTASDMQAEEEEEVEVDSREQEKSQSNATAEQATSDPAELAETAQTPEQDASWEGLQHTAELQDRQSVARESPEEADREGLSVVQHSDTPHPPVVPQNEENRQTGEVPTSYGVVGEREITSNGTRQPQPSHPNPHPAEAEKEGGEMAQSKSEAAHESTNQVRILEPKKEVQATADPPASTAKDLTGVGLEQKPARTQSAPGSRSSRLAAQREEEEREKQKRLNDAAFVAWVSRKNEEVSERRKQERAKLSGAAEEQRRKKEMCELAYQNWLDVKNKHLQRQRVRETSTRPSTSVPKKDEEKCQQAFESWKKKKCTQQMEEVRMELLKSREMEEAVEKTDPDVIDKAYKK